MLHNRKIYQPIFCSGRQWWTVIGTEHTLGETLHNSQDEKPNHPGQNIICFSYEILGLQIIYITLNIQVFHHFINYVLWKTIMLASVVLGFKLQLNYFYPRLAVQNDSLRESNRWQLWHHDNKINTQLHLLSRDDDDQYQEAKVTCQHVFVASRLFWISPLWPNGTFLLLVLQINLRSQTPRWEEEAAVMLIIGRRTSTTARIVPRRRKSQKWDTRWGNWTTSEKKFETSSKPMTKTKTS